MEQSQTPKTNKKNSVIFGVLTFTSILMLLISTRSLYELPEQIGMSIFSFFQGGLYSVGNFFTESFNSLAELQKLKEKYHDAVVKLEEYSRLERDLSDIRQESLRLKEQLGFSIEPQFRKLSAEIIAKDPEGLFPTIIINKGAKDGVTKNLPVIAYQNGIQGLVGRVIEVGQSTSIVLPAYDASTHVAARLQKSRYEGLISGLGSQDAGIVMRYVKKRAKEEIQFGDLVVTSGMQSVYPKDIAIGRVSKLKVLDFETSIEIEIEPIIDFAKLEYVFLVFFDGSLEGAFNQ